MKRPIGRIVTALVPAVLLLSALPALATDHKYSEDFSTTLYKDALNTTARWDDAAGELKLFPFVPTLAGTCDTPSWANGVAVAGDYAFVADANSGLQVIDISDPQHPALVGTYNTPGFANRVAITGDHALVADGEYGLRVIDISDPVHPLTAGSYNTPGEAHDVTFAGDYAYVADGGPGLHVIDISNPASPSLAGTCDTPGAAYGVAVSGDYAFVADYGYGLQVIDISDPTHPALVGSVDTSEARSVTISGVHAFVADTYSGLRVIDVSDPENPLLVGTCDTPEIAYGVTVWGDRAFVADANSGLQVIDISDPTSPVLAGTCDTPSMARDVTVAGDYAFVADYSSGLQVVSISHPTLPVLVAHHSTSDQARGVTISGDRAYVAEEYSGLRVIDISDPTNPVFVGTCDTPGYAQSVTVSGAHAFVADLGGGLQVIDISNPGNPFLEGTYNTPGAAYEVVVWGDHAFVADDVSGLQVIDVGDPANPALVGTCDTPGQAHGVAVSGGYAFVADGDPGLRVIDISNPVSPMLMGACDTPGWATGITVSGDRAFVSDSNSGLQVIDISDPANPVLVGACDTPGTAWGVTVSGDHAYVADLDAGFHVVDVTDPANPRLVGTCDTEGWASAVTVSGDHAFVADQVSGIQVIQISQSEVDTDNNVGRSLAVATSNAAVLRSRLATEQTNTVTWELSADGGVNWQGIVPGESWNRFTAPGSDLLWRSTHAWAAPGVNPTVTRLDLEWLMEAAAIDSIVDLPHDQGGHVRVHFTRSGLDFADEAALPIANYGIWRQVDSVALVAALAVQASSPDDKTAARETPELGDLPVVTYQGRTFFQPQPGIAAAAFPPGTWEWVATVPAVQQDANIAVVPTVADSTGSGLNEAVFVLTAHTTTPSVWYVSDPGSGHSVDNLPPEIPEGLAAGARYAPKGLEFDWEQNQENDLACYAVYRGLSADFEPATDNRLATPSASAYFDSEWRQDSGYYYKVSAIDIHANESGFALLQPDDVTGADTPEAAVAQLRLHPNQPNPFNPQTTIRFDLPLAEMVTLAVYDAAGRRVRVLVDEAKSAGSHRVQWDGRSEDGRQAASGMYFCRLEAGSYCETRRMTLVK